MRLTHNFNIPYNNEFKEMFFNSKNLYNQGLYYIRQQYQNNKHYVYYKELNEVMKTDRKSVV